jgi:formylglycine-generating enzyme required for sulfatase activity
MNRQKVLKGRQKLVVAKTLAVTSSVLLVCSAVALNPCFGTSLAEDQTSANPPPTGVVKDNPKDRLKYVWIPPGTFMMGCSPGDTECHGSEKPSHQVTITKGFWMGQTEVTVAAYQRFASATGRLMPLAPAFNSTWTDSKMPMININWVEAQAYCSWAGGRLPTEGEWEYAARGGDPHARYGELDDIAWYGKNSGGRTHDVAQKLPNGFGLYDTLGNVWEWVNDWFDDDYYQNSPRRDPRGPAEGQYRVLRGGSWFYFPRFVRVSVRVAGRPEDRVGNFGVRCVAGLPNP